MGLQLGYLLGGSILIETVFAWPGTGFLLNSAIFRRDLPMLQGTILVLAFFFVLLNLIVDVHPDRGRPAHQAELMPWPIQPFAGARRPAGPPSRPRRAQLLAVGAPPAAARSGDAGLRRRASSCSSPRRCSRPGSGSHDPYKASMLRRLKPVGSPGYLLGTDELGRDMLSRLIYGGRLSLFMGVTPVVLRPADRRPARHRRGLSWAAGVNTADHAHHRRVLRLPVGAAGDRDLRAPSAPALDNTHPVADAGLHPADHARLRKRHDAGARPRFRRRRAGERRRHARPSCACMCSATCWGRSSSMRQS